MLARAPASSANLGPGFDAIALAVGLHVEVEVTEAPSLSVELRGEGAGLPVDATNLAASVAIAVAGHDRLAITVRSTIPSARGLGSSAAVALAAAAAAGAADPLAVAVGFDGHPENAAAARFGGLVAATMVDGDVLALPLALDEELRVVLVVPDEELATPTARAALGDVVPRADAVFNLQRLALLTAGLADLSDLDPRAMDDRLHQPQRAGLFEPATAIMRALCDAGALGACWSGAGPSVLGIVTDTTTAEVAAAGRHALAACGVAGAVHELAPDREGLVVA